MHTRWIFAALRGSGLLIIAVLFDSNLLVFCLLPDDKITIVNDPSIIHVYSVTNWGRDKMTAILQTL